MFNGSPIHHTAQIKSIGKLILNFFSVSEEILVTSASILCLKSGMSTSSGGNEEIAMEVQHQDSQNQLQSWSSRPFPLQR
ncbi:UNVERIFIED_CONTAM: hypothetical protein NCL1_28508 [Trichonephila clavipes]